MYVCICNAVTESQVLRSAQEGVRNLRDLQTYLGITLECGRCARYAHNLLKGSWQKTKRQHHNGCPHCRTRRC